MEPAARETARRYRILYHHRTQALDGQRVHIREIQRALREAGHEVREVAPVEAQEQAGAATVMTWRRRILGNVAALAPKGVYEVLELAYNLVDYRDMMRAIREFQPDVIYERYSLNSVSGLWAARRSGVPLLLEVNSPLADEKRSTGKLLFHRLSSRLERRILTGAQRVLAVTAVLRDQLVAGTGLEPDRVIVVQNGVRPEAYDAALPQRDRVRARLGLDGRTVVGAVGFFRDWHGIDRLIDALRTSDGLGREVTLLLVGEGPALPGLKTAAAHLGDRVVFTGAVPHDDVPALVAAMDVVAIPRAVDYASPLKLFEYMVAGRPIVAPRQPNLVEVLTDGVDAILFPPDRPAAMIAALERVVQDEMLRRRLGQAARRTIQERELTWDGNATRILRTFEDLAGAPAGRPA